MHIKKHSWESEILGKKMPVISYGHYGLPFLMFPSETDSCEEYEENGMIEALKPFIDNGKLKLFAISGINRDSWLNDNISPEEKSKIHLAYNSYLIEELIPKVFAQCGSPVPIITYGAGYGGYHAANTYFRRPDLIFGTIALSAFFDIGALAKGYFDDNCYFNSPVHYLPNLHDEYWLSFLHTKKHVFLMSGSGENEHPNNVRHFCEILKMKDIPHYSEIWGPEWSSNWETRKEMTLKIIKYKL